MYLAWCDYYEKAKNRFSYQNWVFNDHLLICGKSKITQENTKNDTFLCTSKKYISRSSIRVKFWYVILRILIRRSAVKNLLLQLFWGHPKNDWTSNIFRRNHFFIVLWGIRLRENVVSVDASCVFHIINMLIWGYPKTYLYLGVVFGKRLPLLL